MLKSYGQKEPSYREKYFPYIIFAYREVPNETTSCSPFELLCERHVNGPLAILKGECEEPNESDHSILSYIIDTRRQLHSMANLGTINDTKGKTKQKSYYD